MEVDRVENAYEKGYKSKETAKIKRIGGQQGYWEASAWGFGGGRGHQKATKDAAAATTKKNTKETQRTVMAESTERKSWTQPKSCLLWLRAMEP